MKSTASKFRNFNWKNFFGKWYIVLILACIYIPLIFIIFLSFNEPSKIGDRVSVHFGQWTLKNYGNLFTNSTFCNSLESSLIVAAVVVPISVALALMVCYGMWRNFKNYEHGFIGISNLSIAIPSVINGLALVILFNFTWIPMGFGFGYLTIIFAQVSFCTPYAIVFIYPKLQKFDYNLLLASQDLGCTMHRSFWKILVPYLAKSIFLATSIVFIQSFDDYVITSLVEGKVSVIAVDLYTMNKGISQWAITFGAIIMFITIGIVLIKTAVTAAQEGIKKKKDKKLRMQSSHKLFSNLFKKSRKGVAVSA